MKTLDGVTVIKSAHPGPTLALFAGVHGNETAGVKAIEQILPNLAINRGTLYVVIANPLALSKGVRLVNKNLNRCFVANNQGKTYEDKRARELMKILDDSDALLDLHGFEDPQGAPFIICEKPALELASKLDPTLISSGWAEHEPGATDGYMYGRGKVGICFECGPIADLANAQKLAVKTIYQYLKYYGLLDSDVELSISTKRVIKVNKATIRTSKDYKLAKVKNFQRLKAGEVYGSQDGTHFVARDGEYIIFPRQNPEVGSEAFLIGVEEV